MRRTMETKMGFGITYGGGGDFTPIVRYDARAGRIFRDDKKDGIKTPVDITQTFAAVVDFEQLEVGWIHFPMGAAPDFRMVPFGQDPGPRPSDGHKQGVRFLMRLSGACGGDVREFSTTAAAALGGWDRVHDEYLKTKGSQPGMLPVVKMLNATPVTTTGKHGSSTNYMPEFAITSWVKRPDDLPIKEAAQPARQPFSAPPATGSTAVPPPQPALAGADDFG